jgi:hypothetical protein
VRKSIRLLPSFWVSALLVTLVFVATGCRERINLKVRNAAEQLVVEGYVNDEHGPYWVRITRTLPYFGTNEFPGVDTAKCWITSTDGQVDTLFHLEGQAGMYYTRRLVGRHNTGYTLHAIVGRDTLTAFSWLPPRVNIDTAFVTFDNDAKIAPNYKRAWYATAVGTDPDTIGNFYRIRIFVNDSLLNGAFDYAINRVIRDQFFIQGQSLAVQLDNAPLFAGDQIRIELMSLNEGQFKLYQQIGEQLGSGSPFAPPADNAFSNITGGARGYFGAYSVSRRILRIPRN